MIEIAFLLAMSASPAPVASSQPCDRDPAALVTAKPILPKDFHADGGDRSATVAVTIDATGRVTRASIYKTSGNSVMDAAAIDAAKRSTFAPGESGCKAVGGTFAVEVGFEGYGAPSAALQCPRDATITSVVTPDMAGYSGTLDDVRVAITVTIAPDGSVLEARINQSSGDLYFDRAALAAARLSKYLPKTVAVRRQAQDGKGPAAVMCEPVTGSYLLVTTYRRN